MCKLFNINNFRTSNLNAKGKLTFISNNDTTIEGSVITGAKGLSMQTDGELIIKDAKNTSSTSVDNLNLHIHAGGVPDIAMGDGQVEVELGRATLDKIKKTTKTTTATKSKVSSDENILLESKKSILVEGSDVSAKGDVLANADENIIIKDTKETSGVESDEIHGVATAKFVIASEYAKIAYATLAVKEAGEAVEDAKDNYDDYKTEVSNQESKLTQMRQKYKNNEGFIELADVEEFEELVGDLKEDDKYYKANIALAGVTLATKTTALVAQIAKAATAASTSMGTGLSASIELDVDAIERQLEEYE